MMKQKKDVYEEMAPPDASKLCDMPWRSEAQRLADREAWQTEALREDHELLEQALRDALDQCKRAESIARFVRTSATHSAVDILRARTIIFVLHLIRRALRR